MTDGYLSRDRAHIAKQQRQRRARMVRIDYMPSREALAVIQTKRGPYLPFSTNSGVIDAIVMEWAQLTGINKQTIEKPKTSAKSPEFSDTNARARITSAGQAIVRTSRACAPARGTSAVPELCHALKARVICGARRRRDGQPCQALSVPGKRRCKWHGGCSTGPRTAGGRARSLGNLRQYAGRAERASSTIDPGKERPANIAGTSTHSRVREQHLQLTDEGRIRRYLC